MSHAATFFAGLPVSAADFTPALDAWRRGEDPLDQAVPLHASYEDKPDAPDRIFAAVSPELAVRQVDSWRRLLQELAPLDPQVLHLHHLTPLHDAAEAVFPEVPVVTHLHGTELLMLEQIELFSSAKGIELPASWRYAGYWVNRLRATAQRSGRILAVSTDHAARAVRVLGVPEDRVIVIPNGVDTEHFRRLDFSTRERLALLRHWLVDDRRGRDENGREGSIRFPRPAPSVGEAFGSVYLEAMSAGLPVVATRTGGPPTFLNLDERSPEGWLIPPDDRDALVEVLVTVLRCPNERRARADAAHALVRRGYSW